MRLLALLFAGCSAAKAPESAATRAPVKTATSALLPPPAMPSLAAFSPLMGQAFADQLAAGAGFAALANGLAATALAQQGISVADLAAGMQLQTPKVASTTDFPKLIMQSVPTACAPSACTQVEAIPWNHITRSQCLLYLTTTERCLYAEPACKTAVVLAGPRACCEALAGGSGESPACPPVTLNATKPAQTEETPKAKVGGKLGKAKGKNAASLAPTPGNGKLGKAGKAGKVGRPTISAPCTCVDTVPLPDENEMFDKQRCVSHVSALQKCMVKQSCPHSDMAMLSACCDLLPGGTGYNAACTDPASVLTTFLQSSGGIDLSSFLSSGVDLDALMQLAGGQFAGPAGR